MSWFFNRKPDPSKSYVNQRRHILGKNSNFYVQEAYKALRTNVRFYLSGDGCKKFAITSGLAGEGKSITILNLAISFAETGKKVLLIDADLRRPTMARLLIEKASPGLSNVLAGLCSEDQAIRRNIYPNLDIIFSGEIPPNPSELLGGSRMQKLMDKMSQKYDYIMIDMPPVAIVADVCVMADMLDGVLFLVRTDRTEKEAVNRGLKQLEMSGVKLMGFVLNGGSKERGGYYGKKYRYRHKYKYGYYRYTYENHQRRQQELKQQEADKEAELQAEKELARQQASKK